jgi:CBS domain containing-hemolysin-like protein
MFILLVFLIALSAFFSASETALTSVSRIRVRHMSEEKVPGAHRLEELLKHPSRFLATILFGVTLAELAAASVATVLATRYFKTFGAGIATGVITFFILVYGEITPKSFALQYAERFSLAVALPIQITSVVLYPVVRIFISISNFFIRILGGKTLREGPFVTEEEIKTMVTVGEEAGVIEEEEKDMIHSIFEFGDTIVREVMVPRPDMVAAKSTNSIKDVLSMIMHEGHSRIPIYTDSLDSIVGIVYAKDILKYLTEGKLDVPLESLMRPVYVIPETKKVNELLRELQRRKIHMAMVVDEYGTTVGLVTIEDLLEEIVGEIFDEYDLEETMIEQVDENTIRVDARVGLDEVTELLAITFPEFEGDTIGGFIFSLLGGIPSEGEQVPFENLLFTIEKVGGRRIRKILITRQPEAKVENA